jgi:hypothetical protein
VPGDKEGGITPRRSKEGCSAARIIAKVSYRSCKLGIDAEES